MYTKLLRKVVAMVKQMAGHCDGDAPGTGGHCS